jgi:hypothetical protein
VNVQKKNLNNTKNFENKNYHFLESYNEQVSRGYNTAKADRFRDENKKTIGKKESENRQ